VSIRFLADEDRHDAIVSGTRLREPAIDFLSIHETGLEGAPDPIVLDFAAQEARVIVSHDVSTMPVHFAQRMREGRRSPGLLLASQDNRIGEVIDSLVLVWSASWPSELENRIHYLPSLSLRVER